MSDADLDFDKALLGAAFALAGTKGWDAVSVVEAARTANLDLAQARERFPGRAAILIRFGRLADRTALASEDSEGSVRDRLFYLLMQRLDVLQAHRAGVLALLRVLPARPCTAALLDRATRTSMRWMLNTGGVPTAGFRGELRVCGLYGVWLWAVRAWQGDETDDMSATMAALDIALQRAERLGHWLGGRSGTSTRPPAPEAEFDEPPPDQPPLDEPPGPEVPAP